MKPESIEKARFEASPLGVSFSGLKKMYINKKCYKLC